MLICRHKQEHAVTAWSRRNMYLLMKASAFLREWELRKGIADCLEVSDTITKDLARQLKNSSYSLPLLSGRRHPVILILDEVLLL
jgi:hypothetical protein